MPRDLGDVLDYFLPGAGEAGVRRSAPAPTRRPVAPDRPAALPIVGVPLGEHDVLRAAYAWNLSIEVARLGASATLVVPAQAEPSPLWPAAGPGPVGAELVAPDAGGLGELNRAALDVAVARAADSREGGVVLVGVPLAWLASGLEARGLMRWVLLFASPERHDLRDTYALAKRVWATSPESRLGVTIHGARRIADAEDAFQRLAGAAGRHLSRPLTSYGLLVDDLHVYRAIVARRPIGLEHPQSRAARALRDVARLLLEDARIPAVA